MMRTIKWVVLATLLSTLCGAKTHAQTINAASCSSTDVQTAISKVAADGTTVLIPAGTCTWTTAVTYSGTYSVTIQGQTSVTGTCGPGGTCTVSDITVIIDGLARGAQCGSPDGSILSVNSVSGKSVRVTGITFSWGNAAGNTCVGTLNISGTGQANRVDHSHFINNSYVGLGWGGMTFGVVDHNVFDMNNGSTWNAIVFHEPNWIGLDGGSDPLNVGDGSWADNTTFGSNRFIYVENNFFNWSGGTSNGSGYADDCTSGGRFVWRYNQMNNAMLQTHPTGGSLRHRGCRALEVYQNNFAGNLGAGNDFIAFWFSSGSGLIWGNTVNNGYSHFVELFSVQRDNLIYAQTATPNGWGYCGTSFNGSGSNWDQSPNTSSGRRCMDRPGAGVGDRLVNDFPNVTNKTTGCSSSSSCAWPRQSLEPVYEWLNNSSASFFWAALEGELLANEDYYNYTGSFNGASGVGSGTLAGRPSACTTNPDSGGIGGVGYWATDQGPQGTLYTCTKANTWTAYYTPYTYPHPLISSSGTPPAPPTGLSAIVN